MNSIRTHIRECHIKTSCAQIAADEERQAMADLSSADGEKVVLVHVSERARPVKFRGNNDLKTAIWNVFRHVLPDSEEFILRVRSRDDP